MGSCVGMAPTSSKFYLRVAHKRSAMLEWHLPPLNASSGGMAPCSHLNFGFIASCKHHMYAVLYFNVFPTNTAKTTMTYIWAKRIEACLSNAFVQLKKI